MLVSARAVPAQTVFDQNGFGANRDSYSVLPYEYVDPLSGNLTLVVNDLTLPGNAGFSLSVQRVYNSALYPHYDSGSLDLEEDSWAGIGWRLHFGRVLHEDDDTPGATQIEMPDGSRHSLYHSPTTDGWITKDFWVYNKSTHMLKLPNGIVHTFGRSVFIAGLGIVRYATEIHDPFANSISFTYFDSNGPPDGVAQIHQDLGQGQARDVTFTYDPTLKGLASMSYNGLTWTYTQTPFGPSGYSALRSVQPPAGLSWSYDYESDPGYVGLAVMRVPGGGTVSYTYDNATRVAGSTTRRTRVVTHRLTGGDRITPGTWTFLYGQGPNQDTSIVSCPCGTTSYRYNGIGVNGSFAPWMAGSLAEKVVSENGVVLERQTVTWLQSEPISTDSIPGNGGLPGDPAVYNALPLETVITRGSSSWTTSLEYRSGLGNFNDYGRPWQITSSGQLTRRVTNTFQYGFAPYIVNRVASEEMKIGPESVTSFYTYDLTTGFTTSVNSLSVVTNFEPTAQGNVGAVIDANGHRTAFTYQWGVKKNTTTPLLATQREIDPTGVVLSETAGTLTTRYEYDAGLRLKMVRPPGTNPISYEYDDLYQGWVRIARDQAQSSMQLDGFGRVVHTANRLNLQTRTQRDACGRATFQSAPYTTGTGDRGVTTQYDALGRTTQTTGADGTSTMRFGYDGIDLTVTDAAGRVSYQHYEGFGSPGDARLIWVQDAAQQRTTYAYDVLGHLVDASGPGSGPHRQWFYDGKGRLHHDTQPETGTTSYEYDAVGNPTRITDANGHVTVLSYDANDRLTSRDLPGTDADVTWTLDAIGRVATQQTPLVTTTFTYDAAGRLDSRTDHIGTLTKTSSYLYDSNDNLAQVTYPTGRLVTYSNDIENRLTAVQQNGSAFAGNFTYDDSGRPAAYTTGAVTHTVSYDVRDRVSHLTLGVPGSPALDLTYHYDAVSRVLGIDDTRPSMTQSFGYDVLDRLTSANGAYGALAWTYDAGGNRVTDARAGATTNYAYDSGTLRLMSTSGGSTETFTYDSVGQLTTDSRGRYSYLPTGLLQRVTDAATGTTELGKYAYDADDLRVQRDVGGRSFLTFRSASGQTLSEYENQCGTVVWARDVIYAGSRAIGAIKADQTLPSVAFSAASSTVAESAGTAQIGITLTTATGSPITCPVTVGYRTQPLTGANAAQTGSDFVATSGIVTFPSGSPSGATQSVGVSVMNDWSDEPDEAFTLVLSSPIGATLVPASSVHTLTIQDDDAPPTLMIDNASANENTGQAVFHVYVSVPSAFSIQADCATQDLTAHAGYDYLPMPQPGAPCTLTIPPLSPFGTITVYFQPDTWTEPDEIFRVVLSNPVNATLAWPAGNATILNDDLWRTEINTSLPGNYFADGTAAPGYDDYVIIGNRHNVGVVARMTFTEIDGSGSSHDLWVPAHGRVSFRVGDETTITHNDVSIAVQSMDSAHPIDADHSVYWGSGWQGGRSTEGVSPSQTWYFAEGSTGYFEEYLTVFNPNATAQDCYIDFWGVNGGIRGDWHHIEAGPGREKIRVRDLIGSTDHGSRIWCTAPVVAERTMTWQRGIDEREGHSSPGSPGLSTTWYFAEGDTGFATFLALFNFQSTAGRVRIEYLHANANVYTEEYPICAGCRLTVTPPATLPLGSFGYRITSLYGQGIVAERSMYYGPDWTVGTSGVGTPTLSTEWLFQEGGTGPFWDTFILLANPSATTATVYLSFTREDGNIYWTSATLSPNQRQSVYVDAVPGVTAANFTTHVYSNVPIVAERATYWPGDSGSQMSLASPTGEAGTMSLMPSPEPSIGFNPYATPLPRATPPTDMYHAVAQGQPAGNHDGTLQTQAPPGQTTNTTPTSTTSGTATKTIPSGVSNSTTGGPPWYGAHLTGGRRPQP